MHNNVAVRYQYEQDHERYSDRIHQNHGGGELGVPLVLGGVAADGRIGEQEVS